MAGGLTGNWAGAGRVLSRMGNPLVLQRAFDIAARREAHRIRRIMIEAFNKGGPEGVKWPPLATFTQLVSRALGFGDRKPLMRTGGLRNSIQVHDVDDGYFVGVHRSARGKDGKELINVALAQEEGRRAFTVRVTPRMRAFFYFLSIKTRGQIRPISERTKYIAIGPAPARPFVAPVWEAEADKSASNMADSVRKSVMGG